MLNRLILSFILSFLLFTVYSQNDTLYLYDGRTIPIKLIKVNYNTVSYLLDSVPKEIEFKSIHKLTLSDGKFILFKKFETDTHRLYRNQLSINLIDCIINQITLAYNRLYKKNFLAVGAFISYNCGNSLDIYDFHGDIRGNKTFESDYWNHRDFDLGFIGNLFFIKGRNSGAYVGLTTEFGRFKYAYTNGSPVGYYSLDYNNWSEKHDYYLGTCLHLGFNATLSRQIFFGMRGGAGYGIFHTVFGFHNYMPYVAEIKLGFRW